MYSVYKCNVTYVTSCLVRRQRAIQFNGVYLKKLVTDYFFEIFVMETSCVALSIKNIKTRASREMTSRKKWGGGDVAKHWNVAGRGICHL